MNIASKFAILMIGICVFPSVHAQTNAVVEEQIMSPSEEEQIRKEEGLIQKHVEEINKTRTEVLKLEGWSEPKAQERLKEMTPTLRQDLIEERNKIKKDVKIRHPNFNEEQINQQTNQEADELFANQNKILQRIGEHRKAGKQNF